MPENGVCPACDGRGWTKCSACSGTGYLSRPESVQTTPVRCSKCQGAGHTAQPCTRCRGTGRIGRIASAIESL